MPDPITWIALLFGALGLVFLISAMRALRRVRLVRALTRLSLALVGLVLAALFGALAVGMQGYHALTREETVALVDTQPFAPRHFRARFRFPDGRERSYALQGDELYVDARVLKWRPLVNVLGLHTAYELDRVAGRYRQLHDEQRAPRTVYSLRDARSVDLFELRQRYAWLAPFLDAEYGSATFISVEQPQRLEVRISTTGLLIRRVGGNGAAEGAAPHAGGD
jgi:hypothetical protein